VFDYRARSVDASADDIVTFCRDAVGDADVERLVGWLAWRTGRNQAMAGAGPPMERLRHAAEHWLDDERRGRLLRWLRHRVAQGLPPVPG
jgi:hypothetical protein